MKIRHTVILSACVLYLLFFPAASVQAARQGLLLWYHSLIPVLFPFMILSTLIIRLHAADPLLKIISRPLRLITGCSRHGAFAVLTGFLFGFPMGAGTVHELLRQQLISEKEARRLYGYVNNLSPAFLISFVACSQLKCTALRLPVLISTLGASLLYGALASIPERITGRERIAFTLPSESLTETQLFSFSMVDDCIGDCAETMLRLGGYIVLFSILSDAALQYLPTGSLFALIPVSAIEVTNGVQLLCSSALTLPMKYLLVSSLCAFGGCSAFAQAVGIARMDTESVKSYIKSRAMITLLSLLLSSGVIISGCIFH